MLRLSIFLLAFVSCSKAPQIILFNKTTTKELMKMKGEPLEIKETSNPEINTLVYEKNQKFQVRNNIVEAAFRDPVGPERKLLYWQHKFKDSSIMQRTELPTSKEATHPSHEVQYDFSEEGISLLYNEQAEQVIRVIEYEKFE